MLLLCASAPGSSATTYENFPGSLRNLLVMKVQFVLRVSLVGSISVDEGVSQVLWLTTSYDLARYENTSRIKPQCDRSGA